MSFCRVNFDLKDLMLSRTLGSSTRILGSRFGWKQAVFSSRGLREGHPCQRCSRQLVVVDEMKLD